MREEAPKFTIQLGGQRLVVCKHQRRALRARNNLADDVGFAAPGDPEQRLRAQTVIEPLDELDDRLGLVPRRLKLSLKFEWNLFHAKADLVAGWYRRMVAMTPMA